MRAPVLVTGWCWAAAERYLDPVRDLLVIDRAIVIGSSEKTDFDHAEKIYPLVINTVVKYATPERPSTERTAAELQTLFDALKTARNTLRIRNWSVRLVS